MNALAEKECTECKGQSEPMPVGELGRYHQQIGTEWKIVRNHHLEREYKFKDFRQALDFTNRLGELAERVQHHPDIYLAWGQVKVMLWTHKVDGLNESDFIFDEKVNELPTA
ncbi:MAG: transcriptional coactivator/pterin dehydratase [Verrucomicrobiales bacterium]|nr:transcriptional coactivator/pterin dehydratase [Verrucomicrobiales bacterium]